MYKGSSNTSVVKMTFLTIEDFEKYLNNAFRRIIEILHYKEVELYGDNQLKYLHHVEVTMIIDNTVY